ncbi:MAG: hypothetical protein C4520_00915 [Candidatus Abyssobacteria bacterium SURF_5]|uniref:Uncharacterized protein n=1 Tax=Abyssobacteria bacterium (strain SURF_5) TaxID=2093360 RepID=A0A3A4P6W2_ABYX5|nr:MAG: hypothetical protein C4520_00915 [Candidatus Abyssubacteria bacterium SURF_5]
MLLSSSNSHASRDSIQEGKEQCDDYALPVDRGPGTQDCFANLSKSAESADKKISFQFVIIRANPWFKHLNKSA